MTTSNAAPMVCVPVEAEALTAWLAEELQSAESSWIDTMQELWEDGHDVPDEKQYAALWIAERLPERLAAAPAPQPVQGEAVAWIDPASLARLEGDGPVATATVWNCDNSKPTFPRIPLFTQPPAPAVGDGGYTPKSFDESVMLGGKYPTPAVQIAAPGDVERDIIELLLAFQSQFGPRRPRDEDDAFTWDRIDAAIAALRSQGQADAVDARGGAR